MDRAPLVAMAGQGATTRMHKESHQILDLGQHVRADYQIRRANPRAIVRKAFKVAQTEKPGASVIDFPGNIAAAQEFSGTDSKDSVSV